jgi:hypothetical protein
MLLSKDTYRPVINHSKLLDGTRIVLAPTHVGEMNAALLVDTNRYDHSHQITYMTFRHRYCTDSTRPIFSAGDVDVIEGAIEDIRVEWEQHGQGCAPDYGEIIDIALRRLRQDLDSGSSSEVIEDLRREIGYRQWCAAQVPMHGRV